MCIRDRLTGYLAYTITHHAIHHWHLDNTWLKRRKRWHALHHHRIEQSGCYGVTSTFLDHVFGATHRAATPEAIDKDRNVSVSYTHLRAHETVLDLVCR